MCRSISCFALFLVWLFFCSSSLSVYGAANLEKVGSSQSDVFSQKKTSRTGIFQRKLSNGRFAKKWGKARRFFQKIRKTPLQDADKKRKLSFGVKALLFLGGGLTGLLLGTGIGNFMVFIGWLLALVFGLRGLKNDDNKFPAVIALALVGLLFLSTITFLEVGVF